MRYLATKDLNFSVLMLNAEEVSQKLLQQAQAVAVSVLSINGGVDKVTMDIPHDLDGGWPDVDPDDAFVIYAQIPSGYTANDTFGGLSAMATGSNKQTRERGVALALLLAAAVEKPDEVTCEILQEHDQDISKWVLEARRSRHQLKMQTEARSATAASSRGNDCDGSEADVFDFAQHVAGDGVEHGRCIVFTDGSDSSVAYSCDDDIDSSGMDSIDSSDSTSAPHAVRTFRDALQYLDNPMLRVCAHESSCDFSDDEDANRV